MNPLLFVSIVCYSITAQEIADRKRADLTDRDKIQIVAHAALDHHIKYRCFPFVSLPQLESIHKDLSWRVRVLPFMKHAETFRKLQLDKPWNAKTNAKICQNCERAFTLSSGGLLCNIKTGSRHHGEIHDGSSNTIMLIENRNVTMPPWQKPVALTIDDAIKVVQQLKKGEFLWVATYHGKVYKLPSMKDAGYTSDELRTLLDPRDARRPHLEILEVPMKQN